MFGFTHEACWLFGAAGLQGHGGAAGTAKALECGLFRWTPFKMGGDELVIA